MRTTGGPAAEADRNPLQPFLDAQGLLVLDGGLATELEARGYDLNDSLWSAKVLLENPDAVRAVHLDYLRAGADCIATATYQASLQGFRARGLTTEDSVAQLRRAVSSAVDARDEFWSGQAVRTGRLRPLVAASVGPYGAYLADGSEYTGNYGLTKDQLIDFHRERWGILASAGADILACETVPSAVEAEALLTLLQETRGRGHASVDARVADGSATAGGHPAATGGRPTATTPPTDWAWLSFSCRDGERISDGTRLEDVARLCNVDGVAAIGINCTPPSLIESLINEARKGTDRPILVYPNSGETYDAVSKTWAGESTDGWMDPGGWIDCGASGVGGCCRVGPDSIAELRLTLLG